MGETIEFASNGSTCQGYLAAPDGGGPGIVVIQEWWGLDDHIKDVCDRFATEGYAAVAPDLYGGNAASEPDEAGKLMMALNIERAAKDLSGAVDAANERGTGNGVGVIGFCMGGGLALYLSTSRPDLVKAVVPFYGVIPWESAQPDYSNLAGAVQGHYAADDGFLPVDQVKALEQQLDDLGKEAELFVYPDTDHAFFNDTREAYDRDAAQLAWERTLQFFARKLR